VLATTTVSPVPSIHVGLVAALTFIEEHRDVWRLYLGAGVTGEGPLAERARQARAEWAASLGGLLIEAGEAGGLAPGLADHTAALAQALTGATIAVAERWLQHERDVPKELQALRLMNLVWMGFGDLLEGRLWTPPPRSDRGSAAG
jgi:hypothetical protein